jgi:hypothetical protein
VIIADGMVEKPKATVDAIIEASNYAMSIIMIGVGDAAMDLMEFFDDGIKGSRFDNFRFVKFKEVEEEMEECETDDEKDVRFTTSCLMEVPDQYQFIKEEGLLHPCRRWLLPDFEPTQRVLQPPRPKPVVKVAEEPIRLAPSQLDPAIFDPGFNASSPISRMPPKESLSISRMPSKESLSTSRMPSKECFVGRSRVSRDWSMSPSLSRNGSKPSSPGRQYSTEDTGIPSISRASSKDSLSSAFSSSRAMPPSPSIVKRSGREARGTRSRQPSVEGLIYRQPTTELQN